MHDRIEQAATSASLLARVRDPADESSWREFEGRYGDLILRYCRRRGLQTADCEDVRQSVWVNLSKGLRSFDYDPSRGRFRDYLGRVVRNAISRHFSRNRNGFRALDSAVVSVAPAEGSDHDTAWEQEWVNYHYRLAMARVRTTFEPRSVKVFDRLLAGERATAIAEDLGMTFAAVNQAKHRIKTRMRELIARQIREEDEPDTFGKL